MLIPFLVQNKMYGVRDVTKIANKMNREGIIYNKKKKVANIHTMAFYILTRKELTKGRV